MESRICTSCGAPLVIRNRFSKVLVCDYCGTHLKIDGDTLTISGRFPKLAGFPSLFSTGASGTILGKSFSILGRMRYRYDGGYFDEWFLDFDGGNAWLTEDEGTYTLYSDLMESVDISEIEPLRAGQNFLLGEKKVMIKEKGRAVVDGGEGELYFYVKPGTGITYIDAVSEGKKVAIEYSDEEIEIFSGRPLMKRDIVVSGGE